MASLRLHFDGLNSPGIFKLIIARKMEVTVSRSETYARKIFLMKLPLLTQCDADESCTYLDDGSQALGAACVVLGVHYPTVPDERIAQSSPGAGRWKVSPVWCLQFACLCSETSFRLNCSSGTVMAIAMDPINKKRSGSFSVPMGDSFDSDLTFEALAMKSNPFQTPLPPQQFAIVHRDSSSGSDTAEAAAAAVKAKNRQSARRSKSERLQGSKPRVNRRDRNLPLDLANSNSGSVGGGLSSDPAADPYSYLRKAPSAGRLMADPSFNDTPDGSPRGLRRQGSSRPPLPSVALPASTPDTSPSLNRRLVSSASSTAFNSPSHPNINRLTQRGSERSPVSRTKEGCHRRAGSVRLSGNSSATGTPIAAGRRSTYLDVPDLPGPDDDSNGKADEDSYRLRSFDLTRKGNSCQRSDGLVSAVIARYVTATDEAILTFVDPDETSVSVISNIYKKIKVGSVPPALALGIGLLHFQKISPKH